MVQGWEIQYIMVYMLSARVHTFEVEGGGHEICTNDWGNTVSADKIVEYDFDLVRYYSNKVVYNTDMN